VDIGAIAALVLAGWLRQDADLRARGLVGAATVAGAGVLDQVLKNTLCRARPSAPEAGAFFINFPCFPAEYAYASFPSGHATTAFATAVLLTLWYPRWAGAWLGLAALVGLSRVVLGSHFPSDVLAGALLGSAVALAAHAYVPAARRADSASPAGPA
jgi:undecaprenyl-diphosphatase